MEYLLQQYDNSKWGYKGIDDCANELMLDDKGIGEDCKIINQQQEDEDREAFFARINDRPNEKEYGSNEKLDRKINNGNWEVRSAVAKQGYGLDILINDKDETVRCAVARQRYGLDKLINDEDLWVRAAVADQGYGLDKLVNDEDDWVRKEIAKQGYRLDKLIDDTSECVRNNVLYYIKGNNVSLNDLIIINEDFDNESFYYFLDEDDNNIFFIKYFEQFIKEKLQKLKKDEWFDKIIEKCDIYNSKEFKNKEIRNILDEYWGI